MILTIAEKGPDSTSDRSPIQAQYRPEAEHKECVEQAQRFAASGRPKLRGHSKSPTTPYFVLRNQALTRTGVKKHLARWLYVPEEIVDPQPPNFTFCRALDPAAKKA
jgi:hypothetical protein